MTEQPERVDLSTPDLAAANRDALIALFPGVLADGILDATRLGDLLEIPVSGPADGRERFGLMWAGKQEAVRSLLTPSHGTLVPDMERSVDFDNGKNVFIEGDNLEVLKLLQRAYNDKVKMIYIDPPYNTGNDFVYNDDFSDGLQGYLEFTGQVDVDGNRHAAAADTSGRLHSRWLSMMYPRLVLARNLLTQDGFIFISISDIEGSNLRLLCDEVFGAENRIETFIWQSIFRPSNMSKRVRRNAEYILCYARDATLAHELVERYQDPQGEASLTQNNNAERELTFPAGSLECFIPDGRHQRGEVGAVCLMDELVVEDRRNAAPVRIRGRFKWSQAYLDDEIAKGVYLCIKSESMIPYYRKDYKQTALRPTKILPRDLVGDVLEANAEVGPLIGDGVFDYPKPTSLLRLLIRIAGVGPDDLVLDFFAGSGTTAHAVALENGDDDGNRRSISINIPEPTSLGSAAFRAGYHTVSEICCRRIIAALNAAEAPGTSGLRVFKLGASHFRREDDRPRDVLLDLVPETLANADAPAVDLAVEIFVGEGIMLESPIEILGSTSGTVLSSGGVTAVISPKLSEEVVDLSFAQRPRVVVFLEDGFSNSDTLKVNALTRARELGITTKTV